MQTIKLTIPGAFWDSQIYQGRLYLFERDGGLRTIDWDKLIDGIPVPDRLNLALQCAFKRSDYLYGTEWDLLFSDPDVKATITAKFASLTTHEIEPGKKLLRSSEIKKQSNPFPFPHADSTIYKKALYVVGSEGLWRSNCSRRGVNPISSRPQRQWDCPTISVAAAYGALALAAGSEGLWTRNLDSFTVWDDDEELTQLSTHDCDACEYMYFSVYGSSYLQGGFLAEYEAPEKSYSQDHFERKFSRILPASEIFNEPGQSWGTRDKIYLAHNSHVLVATYNPYSRGEKLTNARRINIAPWKGDLVSGGVCTFGAIFEYDNAIVIIPSAGNNVTLIGEPVNWRVFPNSRQYQNHLHVIYEDRIEIHSFNQDYFVEQSQKDFGSRPYKGS